MDNPRSNQRPTLITGSNGKTGRRVMQRLNLAGHPARAGSRRGDTPFDWEKPEGWAAALAGAGAAYVSFFPDLAVPGAAQTVGAFAERAATAGLERLVLLSGRGEPEAEAAEQAVKAAMPQTTIVRCSWFAQNFSESFLLEPILAGQVILPVEEVREPFVDAEDIADVAFAALSEPGHEGRLYELTGPRALRFQEATAEIGAAIGRPIEFRSISLAEFTEGLRAEGLAEPEVALIAYLFAEVLDGRNEAPAGGVEAALGRPPRDFSAYAERTAAGGVWRGR